MIGSLFEKAVSLWQETLFPPELPVTQDQIALMLAGRRLENIPARANLYTAYAKELRILTSVTDAFSPVDTGAFCSAMDELTDRIQDFSKTAHKPPAPGPVPVPKDVLERLVASKHQLDITVLRLNDELNDPASRMAYVALAKLSQGIRSVAEENRIGAYGAQARNPLLPVNVKIDNFIAGILPERKKPFFYEDEYMIRVSQTDVAARPSSPAPANP
ncbi:MAG: hypothetical protein WC989_00280 [Micavibrio sp.]